MTARKRFSAACYAGPAQKRSGAFQVKESDVGTRLQSSIGRTDCHSVLVLIPKADTDNVSTTIFFINIAGATFIFNIFFLLPSRSQINVINCFNFNDLIFVVRHDEYR
jgi:hypothetical protein